MRKHIDYFYKCFDREDVGIDRIMNERFNEYGYNFDSTSKKIVDHEEMTRKTNYQSCQKLVSESKKK